MAGQHEQQAVDAVEQAAVARQRASHVLQPRLRLTIDSHRSPSGTSTAMATPTAMAGLASSRA